MAIRFIETDSETGDGYNIDDSTGLTYDASGNQLDSNTAEPMGPEVPTDTYENNFDNGSMQETLQNPAPKDLSWRDVAKQFGLIDNKTGQYDLKAILGAAGAASGLIGAATATPYNQKSIGELRAGMLGGGALGWTPEQLAFNTRPMQTGSALQRVYAADMQSPMTRGKTNRQYAEGGEVEGGEVEGALSQAFAGAVQGDDGGQSDLIDAKLSPGEYVFDAESVSALGDGNTAAGIAKLDELRQQLRAQKRSAPVDDIPPQARGPLSYMGGVQ